MQSIIEFETSDNLKAGGISSIRKEGNTIVIVYHDVDIRFDVNYKSWTKTIQGFKSSAKDIITNKDFIQAISATLSKNYLQIINLNGDIHSDNLQIINDHDSNEHKRIVNIKELESKIPDKNFAEYVIGISKRTVKCEDSLVRQILYTGLSSYSKDPINLAIIAPTSEGKTYPVMEVMKYFPKEDIWNIGSMSTKALVRQHGIAVDSNNESIQSKIKELKKSMSEAQGKEDKKAIEDELQSLKESSKTLIDIGNKTIIFLEPPNEELWNLVKPILSHDKNEIEFPYVDSNLVTKNIVVRGFPAIIVCSAKDESRWSVWPEIQSRFLIASPNMVSEKYKASNILIAQKKGLPSLIQKQVIVSDKEIELTEQCILFLKENMMKYRDNQPWIPYGNELTDILPSQKGTSTRITNRIFSLIDISAKVNSYSRPKLQICNETCVVATLEDLSEALSMTRNISGIPAYKMKFLNEVFYPCYYEKKAPDQSGDGKRQEDRIAVTSRDLCEYYKTVNGKAINTDILKKTFLNEIYNSGIIEKELSNTNLKQYIYYPVIEQEPEAKSISSISKLSHFDKILHDSGLVSCRKEIRVPDYWLEMQILELLSYRKEEGSSNKISLDDIKLFDKDGNRTTIPEFCSVLCYATRYDSLAENQNSNINIDDNMQTLHHGGTNIVATISNTHKFDMKDNNFQERMMPISKSQIHLDSFVDQNAN